MENIKIEPINPKDYICPECFYIVGTKEPQKQMMEHISEKHKPVNFEKERRNFVDKIWCSHE